MIVFLAAESPWPSRSGGRVRMAGLVKALRSLDDVTVLVARRRVTDQVDESCIALPASPRSRATALLAAGPRLGRGLLHDAAVARVREECRGARALVVSHSYLASELPALGLPVVVDFQNLEVQRQRSNGVLGRLESLKARHWEPRVAARATLRVCVDAEDAATVARWGPGETVVVPNVVEAPVSPPSPDHGYALAVADWAYGPNAAALAWLRAEVMPRLDAELVLAGRGSETVPGGRGFVDDLTSLYDGAAVVVCPVRSGAGTQLKVAEALGRGRLVVTTAYGLRSVPAAASSAVVVADSGDETARAVDELVHDVARRRSVENALRAAPFPRTWDQASVPLLTALAAVVDA